MYTDPKFSLWASCFEHFLMRFIFKSHLDGSIPSSGLILTRTKNL